MMKFASVLLALAFTLGMPTLSNASTATSSDISDSNAEKIDKILDQISRQRSNPSSLIHKSSYESDSLAKNSALLGQRVSAKYDKDMVSHLTLVASHSVNRFKQSGRASWYGKDLHGSPTASGERFDMNALTAAHPSLPFNTFLKVTNKSNGKSVIVKVNDRRPSVGKRVLDLSYGAAKKLDMVSNGVANVSVERININ